MIEIKRIEPYQVTEAKRLIVTIADSIYHWDRSIEESLRDFDKDGTFDDMVDIQSHYFDRRGLFLIVQDDGRMIGTGAVRKIDESVCELKRIWLLPEYHGRGIGYRVVQMLFDFARATGYTSIRLETGQEQQRAIKFYERLGFHHIDPLEGDDQGVYMEMAL